jgi:hypothetical protein
MLQKDELDGSSRTKNRWSQGINTIIGNEGAWWWAEDNLAIFSRLSLEEDSKWTEQRGQGFGMESSSYGLFKAATAVSRFGQVGSKLQNLMQSRRLPVLGK